MKSCLMFTFLFFDYYSYSSIIEENRKTQNNPILIEQPQNFYFIVRGKPAIVNCKAINTVRINFLCAGQWMTPTRVENILDPTTGRNTLSASIHLERADVMENSGDSTYSCECYAYNTLEGENGINAIRSRTAEIDVAYLKRGFLRIPWMITNVERPNSVILNCIPPEGKPNPEVFWLKDGEEINVKNDNKYEILNTGDLLIKQSHLKDRGNYTCGARNIAATRLSPTAKLVVVGSHCIHYIESLMEMDQHKGVYLVEVSLLFNVRPPDVEHYQNN